MAIASGGTVGTATSNTSGSSLAITATLTANRVAVLIVAADNVLTTDGADTNASSVTDGTGNNAWIKIGEFTNGNAAAGAGATVSIWICKVVTGGSQTVTVNFVGAITAKCATIWDFTVSAGSTLRRVGTVQSLANDAADPGSMSISGLTSNEYLFVYATAGETNAATAMTGTSYTAFTATQVGTTAVTGMAARGLFRVLTGTGDTLDPTFTAVDCESMFVAFEEYAITGSAKTFYLKDAAASGSSHGSAQDGGSPPTAATTGTGWVTGTIASGGALMVYGSIRPSGAITGSSFPIPGTPPGTTDCWRSEQPLNGTFNGGFWSGSIPVISTVGSTTDGRFRLRFWKSANADGSGATEITTGQLLMSVATNVNTAAEIVTTGNTAVPNIVMSNEYLFILPGWNIAGAGGGATDNVLFRVGTNSKITTPEFAPAAVSARSFGAMIW
jgi:hypothetical protein